MSFLVAVEKSEVASDARRPDQPAGSIARSATTTPSPQAQHGGVKKVSKLIEVSVCIEPQSDVARPAHKASPRRKSVERREGATAAPPDKNGERR